MYLGTYARVTGRAAGPEWAGECFKSGLRSYVPHPEIRRRRDVTRYRSDRR